MNKAKSLKAFDATQFNLPASVEKADVVILCLPLDQVEETLKIIGPDLREDAVVLDTSPAKSAVVKWFEQHVPPGRHYIGLVPSINPLMLEQSGHGIDAARADLFDKATIGIAAPMNVPPEAVRLAEDLVRLLGGEPLFLDLLEADGMMTTAHTLPQVFSVAMLNMTIGQPGWTEARRFAGRPYAQVAAALGDDTLDSLQQALLVNPERAVYMLDQAIGALTHLRNAVQTGNAKDLEKRMHLAFDDYQNWLKERYAANWNKDDSKPKVDAGEWMKRLFTGERPKRK
jgi:prephenate dehydrogenase